MENTRRPYKPGIPENIHRDYINIAIAKAAKLTGIDPAKIRYDYRRNFDFIHDDRIRHALCIAYNVEHYYVDQYLKARATEQA